MEVGLPEAPQPVSRLLGLVLVMCVQVQHVMVWGERTVVLNRITASRELGNLAKETYQSLPHFIGSLAVGLARSIAAALLLIFQAICLHRNATTVVGLDK